VEHVLGPAAHAVGEGMVGSAVALGLATVLSKRFPPLRRAWRIRRGRRQVLLVSALLTWTVAAVFGLMTVISLLALVFPDGDWQARPSGIITMLAGTGLGAALALRLSLWWWRSAPPNEERAPGPHSDTKDRAAF
jgi:MFS family permease